MISLKIFILKYTFSGGYAKSPYIDPTTGALDAPGLGNSMVNVEADQRRRTDANLSALQLLRRR